MRPRTRARSHVSIANHDGGAKYADVKDYTIYIEKAMKIASNSIETGLKFKQEFVRMSMLSKEINFHKNLNEFANLISKSEKNGLLEITLNELDCVLLSLQSVSMISDKHNDSWKLYLQRISDAQEMPLNFRTKHDIWAKENFLGCIFDIMVELEQDLTKLTKSMKNMINDTKDFLQKTQNYEKKSNQLLTTEMKNMINTIENCYKLFVLFETELTNVKLKTENIFGGVPNILNQIRFDLDKQIILMNKNDSKHVKTMGDLKGIDKMLLMLGLRNN